MSSGGRGGEARIYKEEQHHVKNTNSHAGDHKKKKKNDSNITCGITTTANTARTPKALTTRFS